MKRKILVTGGSGYKGVVLIKKLVEKNFFVVNVDKNLFSQFLVAAFHKLHSENFLNVT